METLKNRNKLINSSEIVALLNKTSSPLENTTDLDPLIDSIRDAKCVILRESSHGTHEYWTCKSTSFIQQKKGFDFLNSQTLFKSQSYIECYSNFSLLYFQ
jgi:erythromycin esterase